MDVAPTAPSIRLPYGPRLTRLLRPLQRALNVANRASVAPLLRWRLGWLLGTPLTGSLMLLRTRGRRTGLLREAPLGYVIRDGAVYCVAGYGKPTPWFRNLVADPAVELVLPTRRLHGIAEPVTDPTEWCRAFRSLIASFALVGRAVVGDVRDLGDPELFARYAALPVVRIRRVDGGRIEAGPFDPGGWGWLLPYGAAVVGVGAWLRRRGRRAARPRSPRPG